MQEIQVRTTRHLSGQGPQATYTVQAFEPDERRAGSVDFYIERIDTATGHREGSITRYVLTGTADRFLSHGRRDATLGVPDPQVAAMAQLAACVLADVLAGHTAYHHHTARFLNGEEVPAA